MATSSSSPSLSELLTSLAKGAKSVNGLPLNDDYDFQMAFSEYASLTSKAKKMIIQILSQAIQFDIDDDDNDKDKDEDDDYDVVLEKCALVGEDMLERVERFIENGGKVTETKNKAVVPGVDKMNVMLRNIVEMEKPQITYNFQEKINNSRRDPFYPPYITKKYHTTHKLNMKPQKGHGIIPTPRDNDVIIAPTHHYDHPYRQEIENLTYITDQLNPPSSPSIIAKKSSPPSSSSHSSTCTFIDKENELDAIIKDLESQTELAIDLEAHNYHSFSGFTCLMQISTRLPARDYLIDTLALRHRIHDALAPIFANPSIVKIMHGSSSDILWLQRDFGIYVVNLFDTGVAARQLKLKGGFGLQHVLKHYVGLNVDKKFQLSDWRERPISEEMREYARGDTRYLVYVYDVMREELTNHPDTSIEKVLQESSKLALRRYTQDPYNPNGYQKLVLYRQKPLTNKQMSLLKTLYDWRDRKARQLDESLHAVCPNSTLIKLALKKGEAAVSSGFETKIMKKYKKELMSVMLLSDDDSSNEAKRNDSTRLLLGKKRDSCDISSSSGWVTPPEDDDDEDNERKLQVELHPDNQSYDVGSYTNHSFDFRHLRKENRTTTTTTALDSNNLSENEIKMMNDAAAACVAKVKREMLRQIMEQLTNPWHDDDDDDTEEKRKEKESDINKETTKEEVYVMPKSMKDTYQMSQQYRSNKKQKNNDDNVKQNKNDTDNNKNETADNDGCIIESSSPSTTTSTKTNKIGAEEETKPFDYSKVGAIGAMAAVSTTTAAATNPFFSGAAAVVGIKKTKRETTTPRKEAGDKNVSGGGSNVKSGGKKKSKLMENPNKPGKNKSFVYKK